jgi:NADH:ubiquinone oxidoreductase subunit 3 (subunit A)
VFLWPWAPLFHRAGVTDTPVGQTGTPSFLLVEMVVFMAILLVGYIYAWRKGVFQWS